MSRFDKFMFFAGVALGLALVVVSVYTGENRSPYGALRATNQFVVSVAKWVPHAVLGYCAMVVIYGAVQVFAPLFKPKAEQEAQKSEWGAFFESRWEQMKDPRGLSPLPLDFPEELRAAQRPKDEGD